MNLKRLIIAITNPKKIVQYFETKGIFNRLSDKKYLKLMYRLQMGKKLDLDNPKTFNEKLQWLKLYDRNPEYTKLVDKYEVKRIVADKIGAEYIIPTLGVWDKFDDIDFDKLPNQFVLKCTHDSGGLVICKDKSKFDIKSAKKKINRSLRSNYYYHGREWPYKNVEPRIIAEEFLSDDDNVESGLTDYKFFCFDGLAYSVMICIDRNTGDPKYYFFDKSRKLLRLNKRSKLVSDDFHVNFPDCIDKMFDLAEKLSKGFPHVRVDLFSSKNKPYFGELTFFSESGMDNNLLPEAEKIFGDLINLEKV